MNRMFKAALFAASLFAGSVASAAVVGFNPGFGAPASANFVQTADISVGSVVNATQIILSGDTAEFTFTALEDLRVLDVSLSGTGTKAALDLVLSGLSFPASNNFQFVAPPVFGPGTATFAGSSFGGFDLFAGEMFTIFWAANGASSAGLTAFFETAAIPVSAVPVPAALPLLLSGVGALALVRRRKSKAVAV